MEKKFKKIMAVVGSTFMIGATMSMAFAAGGGAFPSPFVKDNNADYAIVYGAGAAASDITGANSINTYLNTFYSTETTSDTESSTTTGNFSSSVGISDEIALGQESITGSKLRMKLEDNKLSTLLDTEVNWDNGYETDSYDIHEEILLTNKQGDSMLKLVTNLNHSDGEDLDSFVVLQNDKSLRYRLVFDDTLVFPTDQDDKDNAKELKVSILGKEYSIIDFKPDFSKVTISLSEEKVVRKGDVFTIEGVTLTIGDIFDDAVEINGILVEKEGSVKRIGDIEVQVTDAISHSDITLSRAIIKAGKDIKKEIHSGDEYTKDDEIWEWDIGKENGKQYIGVKYALKNVNYDEDEPEENPISPGQSYIFPENYAAVNFDGITEVNYNDFNLYFDDKDLYSGDSSTKIDDVNVAILEGEEDDSFTLTYNGDEIETDSLYFNYSEDGVAVYFKDIDGDVEGGKEGRIQLNGTYEFSSGDVTTIETVPEGEEVEVLGPAPVIGYTYNEEEAIYNEVTGNYEYELTTTETVPEGEEVPIYEESDDGILGYQYFFWGENHDFNRTVLNGEVMYQYKEDDGSIWNLDEMHDETLTWVEYVEGDLTFTYREEPIQHIYDGQEVTYNENTENYKYELTTTETVPEGEEVEVLGPAPVIGYTYNEEEAIYNEVTGNYEYELTTTEVPEDKSYHVADLVVKDTEMEVGLDLNANKTVYLTLTNEIGGVTKMQLGVEGEEFTHLGSEDEDAETAEVNVDGKDVGTRDYDLMDHYGTIIQNPESNGDNDRVVLSIPSEQVFAEVSIKGQGEVITTETETEVDVPQLGGIVVKDSEINSVKNKNLIIVGGSCINAEAAKLLGGKACGEEFTLKTSITAGKALVQTFTSLHDADKVAVVIAGYNATDTTRAVNKFINDGALDVSLDKKTTL